MSQNPTLTVNDLRAALRAAHEFAQEDSRRNDLHHMEDCCNRMDATAEPIELIDLANEIVTVIRATKR